MSDANAAPPQLTVKAVVLGLLLAMSLAGANAYLGLFAGMTVSASIPAAVISMAILRLWRKSNVLENNIVQTMAASGEAIAAGAIFTFPALLLLDYWSDFHYAIVSLIAGLGGLLGVLFTIPLRRSMIVEQQLPFPEGAATAEVLKIADAPGRGALWLAAAATASALVKLADTGLRVWPSTAQAARYLGSSTVAFAGFSLSPALLGVGYIVGLNVALLVLAGGAISWWIALPIYSGLLLRGDAELAAAFAGGASPADLAFAIWETKIRYLGVGAMLTGGLWALIELRTTLWSGFQSGLRAGRARAASRLHTDRDVPMQFVLAAIAASTVPIFWLYSAIVPTLGVALAMTVMMLIAGFLFSAVAAYLTGLIGSSNNPTSGITIATILLTALMVAALGADAESGPAAAILVGAVVCCAASIGGDNLQDLKAGYMLGATPWRQQIAQSIGVVAAVLVIAPILNLLAAAYGFGAPTSEHPHPLPAPQANLMASVVRGVFGGSLPWGMVATGAAIGGAIVALDSWLEKRSSRWRAPALAVAVGIYLPLEVSTPLVAGGVIAALAARRRSGAADARDGVLFAAGLITGEALLGILLAIPIVLARNADVLALRFHWSVLAGLAALALLSMGLYRAAAAAPRRSR